MERIIGFIGCGNMARAIIQGMTKSKTVSPKNIIASDRVQGSLDFVSKECGIDITANNKEVAQKADILFLAVKPDGYQRVIEEIKDRVKKEVIVVTIAAGQSIESVEKNFGRKVKVIRTMPNTPAFVGEAMTSVCTNEKVTEKEKKEVLRLLQSFGKTEWVEEKLMDVVTGTTGSSPAYVFMMIEAMADGAVLRGMPRDKAYKLAAQTLLGSAKMVLETGKHPGELKDMVCSPGGTTIEAVAALEENGFRHAVMKAVVAATDKSSSLA
ncbi:pyrroline-5-carboxylate reductase [Irregularibacter muris]|uniref:Pyrroline-5-carboxylate reductase n=1 Tax=Irregularibacter muris TaxID=1796619 RepID=A0AAE3HFZ1_9FIRM|nr:pyrroline-5-carboxylate reductase [Irregularibacter muris]MCR1898408.1 pyrroline-5-carboxylate reductase [Irregularibacter muris]